MGIFSIFGEAFSDLKRYRRAQAEYERNLKNTRCIGACKQEGNTIYVYDVNGNYMSHIGGLLIGYTQQSITVKDSSGATTLYDMDGNIIRIL